jgi:hypothetical protein
MQGFRKLLQLLRGEIAGGCSCSAWACIILSTHASAEVNPQAPAQVKFDGRNPGAFEAAITGRMQPKPSVQLRVQPSLYTTKLFWGSVTAAALMAILLKFIIIIIRSICFNKCVN